MSANARAVRRWTKLREARRMRANVIYIGPARTGSQWEVRWNDALDRVRFQRMMSARTYLGR